MVADSMKDLIKNNSVIRQMFEEGNLLREKYGKENVFDFSIGNPSVKPPKALTDAINDVINKEDELALHGYMSNSGYPDVRKSIADYINANNSTELKENNIIMCCGAAAGLNIVLKSIINPGDEVIVFKPYFMEYKNYIKNYNGVIIEVEPNDDFTPDLEDLKRKITPKTKAIIINNPNNPSGALYSDDVIVQISSILKQHDIYIISDEPYREIVYDGKKAPYIPKYYNNTFIVYSYSKSLSIPGERIGYIVLPNEMDDKDELYQAITIANRIMGFVNAPSLIQKVVAKLQGVTSDLNEYTKNRDVLYNSLTEYGFTCFKPQGTFYLFLKSPIADEKEFVKEAKECFNILMVPGSSFAHPGYVRVAFCVEHETIKRSLPKFKELAEHYNLNSAQ